MNERIRRRVEALRARTVERGCTPAEAETAKRMADELVAKHGAKATTDAPPKIPGMRIDWNAPFDGTEFARMFKYMFSDYGGPLFTDPYGDMDHVLLHTRPNLKAIEVGIRRLLHSFDGPHTIEVEAGVLDSRLEYWVVSLSPWGTSLVYRRVQPGGPTWQDSWLATPDDIAGMDGINRRLENLRSRTIMSFAT